MKLQVGHVALALAVVVAVGVAYKSAVTPEQLLRGAEEQKTIVQNVNIVGLVGPATKRADLGTSAPRAIMRCRGVEEVPCDHGHCSKANTCVCDEGYEGAACDVVRQSAEPEQADENAEKATAKGAGDSQLLNSGKLSDVLAWIKLLNGTRDPLTYWAKRFRDVTPAGYRNPSCIARPRRLGNGALAEPTSRTPASEDVCLRIPRFSEPRIAMMKAEIYAQLSLNETEKRNPFLYPSQKLRKLLPNSDRRSRKYHGSFRGVRLLAIFGRQAFLNVSTLAIRRMLIPFGGVVSHVTAMFFEWQREAVTDALFNFAQIPSDVVSLAPWNADIPLWDFTRLYRDVRDGYLHIKFDDDLFFVGYDYDVLLTHAFFFPEDHVARETTDGNATSRDDSKQADCDVVSANVVNHHWLTSLHQQIDALSFWMDRPLRLGFHVKASDYSFPALWAAMHRSFLRTLRNGNVTEGTVSSLHDNRNYIQKFDFGLHDFNCDGGRRRWSINSFLFPWSRPDALRIPFNDEEYVSMSIPYHRGGRGAACALGAAVVVHSMFQHQAVWTLKMPKAANGRSRDDVAISRLAAMYNAVALHMDGRRACCRSTGCPLFEDEKDANVGDGSAYDPANEFSRAFRRRSSLACDDFANNGGAAVPDGAYAERLRCTFPFPADTPMAAVADFLAFKPGAKGKKGRDGGGGGGRRTRSGARRG